MGLIPVSSNSQMAHNKNETFQNIQCLFQTSLPVLDNPFSQRLREIIESFRAQRSRYMKVNVLLSSSPLGSPNALFPALFFSLCCLGLIMLKTKRFDQYDNGVSIRSSTNLFYLFDTSLRIRLSNKSLFNKRRHFY